MEKEKKKIVNKKQTFFSIFDFQKMFPTETKCCQFLFQQRWPDGFKCPKCNCVYYSYITTRELYQCCNCRYQGSITAGTIFHKTRTPLQLWFWMIFMITRAKTGKSILQLQKLFNIGSYKTAWTMTNKIRHAMKQRDANYKLGGILEIDDAYFGERNVTGKRGRGADRKNSVIIAVTTQTYKGKVKPSFVKMEVTENMSKINIEKFVENNIDVDSVIKTDKFKSYHWLGESDYQHTPVRIYDPKKTLKYLPWVHIIIGNIKGIIKGVHHGVSSKHLHRYLTEFCYRFNRRFIENNMFKNLINICSTTNTVTLAELRA